MSTQNITVVSRTRTTIETAFFGNNVIHIDSVMDAYKLAYQSSGTVVTDMEVHRPEEMGLPHDARVLLFNDGAVTGRCAEARKIIGQGSITQDSYSALLRDAVYNSRSKKLYHTEVVVGLDETFMVKAHLLIPEGHENILYNWMMNFQYISEEIKNLYKASKELEKEGDIYIFSDPDWSHPDHDLGLTLFDPDHNCAAILGMKYFGEHKKGTLTLAWNIASRNGYISCHGGLKRYKLEGEKSFVAGIFGLSGSGKSTLTHYKHENRYDVKILHDDAFVISEENGSTVALEPSYFDKTQDYPMGCADNKYLVTAQNCGAIRDESGKVVLMTEDIRNGNGRAIKSKFWAPNRVNYFEEPINAIIWLMKDPTMPPVLKITNPTLAATLGATLATKRSSAERLSGNVDRDQLVIEPYANPFRTYPLRNDFDKFLNVFSQGQVECYIFNTGFFESKKIPKEVTLECLEKVVEQKGNFVNWGPLEDMMVMPVEGFLPDWASRNYLDSVIEAFERRLSFLEGNEKAHNAFDQLPEVAMNSLAEQIEMLKASVNIIKTA